MQTTSRRQTTRSALAKFSTALTIGLSSIALVGCDAQTDSSVRAKVQQAIDLRAVHSTEADAQAKKVLDEASSDNSATPATLAQLAAMKGQMSVDFAQEVMRRIDRAELDLARVSFDLNQLAVQLDSGTTMVNGYRKFDPSNAQQSITQQIAEARGSAEKPTWEFQGMQMPTIEATKQNIAKFDADIAKLNEQVQTLTVQRDSALKDAESAQQSADSKKGQEAVDEFRRATMLRKDAGELSIKIDELNAQTVPLQRDQAVAQGQLAVLEEVVKQLQAQQTALDAGWKSMQEQIASQTQLAQKIVGAEGATPPARSGDDKAPPVSGASIAEKAAEINALAGELKTLRGEAQSHLDDAITQFGAAYKNANDVRTKLGEMLSAITDPNRADAKTLKAAQETLNPQVYQLREASARRTLGALHASEGMSLLSRVNLQASVGPIIERAGAPVPAILRPGNLAKDATTALKLAAEAYAQAEEALNNVAEGTSPEETKNAAKVQQILTNYAWAQVLKADGNAKEAQEKLDKAIALRNGAAEQKIALPALPAELGPTPGAASATPSTQPTDAPTTAPTTPAAPQDTPEEAEVRTVVNSYVDAMLAGDAETIKTLVQVESGQEADFEQQIKMLGDLTKLKEVVTTKLGAEAGNTIGALLSAGPNALNTLKITVNGEEASLDIPGAGPQKAFVRQDGQWKMFFGAPDTDFVKAQRAANAKLAEALPQIISDVESGTIADMQQLQAAIVKAVQPG